MKFFGSQRTRSSHSNKTHLTERATVRSLEQPRGWCYDISSLSEDGWFYILMSGILSRTWLATLSVQFVVARSPRNVIVHREKLSFQKYPQYVVSAFSCLPMVVFVRTSRPIIGSTGNERHPFGSGWPDEETLILLLIAIEHVKWLFQETNMLRSLLLCKWNVRSFPSPSGQLRRTENKNSRDPVIELSRLREWAITTRARWMVWPTPSPARAREENSVRRSIVHVKLERLNNLSPFPFLAPRAERENLVPTPHQRQVQ